MRGSAGERKEIAGGYGSTQAGRAFGDASGALPEPVGGFARRNGPPRNLGAMGRVGVPSGLAGTASGGQRGDAASDWVFCGAVWAVAFAEPRQFDDGAGGESSGDVQSGRIADGECFGN